MSQFVIDEKFLEQVELLSLAVKDNVAGLFGGNHKTKTYGSSCEFADYRNYIPGDDITKIDWNVFARFDKLFLKLFLDERQMHTRIYIDASASMGCFNKSKKALEIAAILAYLSIKSMDKVSIYYIRGHHIGEVFTNIVGKDAFFNEVVKLNDINFNGDSFISDAIIPTMVGYGDGNTIIISDFLTDNNYDNVIDYLRGKKRDVLCLQVLAEEELKPLSRGRTIILDSESTHRQYKKNINKDVLEAYNEALNFVTGRIKDYCASRDATYMLVSTGDSLSHIFLEQMIGLEVLK